jgi:hypothetical protein
MSIPAFRNKKIAWLQHRPNFRSGDGCYPIATRSPPRRVGSWISRAIARAELLFAGQVAGQKAEARYGGTKLVVSGISWHSTSRMKLAAASLDLNR